MPWRRHRPHHDAAVHAHTRETHLATQYPRRHQPLHTQTGDLSWRRRRLLDLHCPAQLRCSTPLAFIVHKYLIYHFLQSLIQCLWILESKNLCLWTCGVCVFTDEWWTDVGDSVIVYLKIYSTCGFFFFFWPFGFVTLCDSVFMTLSLLYYIEKRDRERKGVEFVKIREYIGVVFVCLFFVDW